MKVIGLSLFVVVAAGPAAGAANIEEGKSKAAPCTACHGTNGVSVSDDIPNLAGQRTKYLEAQLKAFKSASRKNAIMNAIAAQLGDADIVNLAAFWSSLPGASGDTKSALLEKIEKTRVGFPEDYKKSFTYYMTINFADRKQVRKYYANKIALAAARDGKPMGDGSMLFVEVYKAKLDDAKKPVMGGDGYFVADKLAAYTAMQQKPGWGDDIPDLYRNGDWNYAVFNADESVKGGVNQAKCFACHKPLDKDSYVFTLKELAVKAKMAK
jgi:cytochrome c553